MTLIADRGAVLAILAALALMPSGCAQVQLAAHTAKGVTKAGADSGSDLGAYKVGDPYQVFGVWYYPAEDLDFNEVGIASWYGREFHGRRTANGAVFDMNGLSAAHRTLPMPSLVRVTNLESGRSLVLVVNDRGPFARGRIIDVSRRAAQLLGFFEKGTAKVRVEAVRAQPGKPLIIDAKRDDAAPTSASAVLEPVPVLKSVVIDSSPVAAPVVVAEITEARSGAAASAIRALYVQAGAFANPNNAHRLRAELVRFGSAQMTQATVDDRLIYRVRLGPLDSSEDADALRERMIAAGYRDARLVTD